MGATRSLVEVGVAWFITHKVGIAIGCMADRDMFTLLPTWLAHQFTWSLSRCSITANRTLLIPVKSDSPARINILLKYAFTVRRDIFSSLAISA